MNDDIELISQIRKGNKYALDVLIKKYYKIIFAYNFKFIGEYHIAYDLTQEVFIKMVKNIKNYEDKGYQFKSWLLKIAVNRCRDYVKSSYYANYKNSEQIFENTLVSEDCVLSLLQSKEKEKKVKELLKDLPENQREIIILRYYEELKFKEIAEVLGKNENTIKTQLRAAMKVLKRNLEREEQHEKRQNA